MLTSRNRLSNSSEYRKLEDTQKKNMNNANKESSLPSHLRRCSDSSVSRIPKCARCRNHGIDCDLKGHKEKCRFKECSCRSCLIVLERQKVTATRVAHLRKQRKLAIKMGSKVPEYQHHNPLTEEEEFILSKPLQNRTSEDPNYRRYDHVKYSNTYHHHADQLASISKPKQSVLLREAQNAYSYFYGRSYYPDTKDERRHSISLERKKRFFREYSYYDHYNLCESKAKKALATIEEKGLHKDEYHDIYYRKCPSPHRVGWLNDGRYHTEHLNSEIKSKMRLSVKTPMENNNHKVLDSAAKETNLSVPRIESNRKSPPTYDMVHEEGSHVAQGESKRLEVLLIMFPEMEEDKLKEILRESKSDVQCAVESLLQLRKAPKEIHADHSASPYRLSPSAHYSRINYIQ